MIEIPLCGRHPDRLLLVLCVSVVLLEELEGSEVRSLGHGGNGLESEDMGFGLEELDLGKLDLEFGLNGWWIGRWMVEVI